MRRAGPMVLLLLFAGRASADDVQGRALLVWPATPAATSAARALADRAAERGAFEVVDAGLIRRRIGAGAAVDVQSFLGQARGQVISAQAALSMNDPQRALEILAPVLRDSLVDLAGPAGRPVLRELLVTRARARLGLRDPVAALADMTFAVRLDPDRAIDPNPLVPAERALLDRARTEAPALATGRLTVTTQPVGASVSIDGEPPAAAPVDRVLPAGDHVVRADRLGRQPAASLVSVPVGGAAAPLALALPSASGPDLVEQIAERVQAGAFDVGAPGDLTELARAAGADNVLVVERQDARVAVRLFTEGRFQASGSSDAAGPFDALWASIETARLGRPARTPGAPPQEHPTPLVARWWFWTAIGAVVVGGVTTGIVLATQEDPGGAVRWGRTQ